MFQSYLWQILVQKHSSIQSPSLWRGSIQVDENLPSRLTKFLPIFQHTLAFSASLHEICQTQSLANLLPHHSTTWDDGSHDVEEFLQILREVSGEIHHNGDGGKEANDARCIIKDMFLRSHQKEKPEDRPEETYLRIQSQFGC